MSPTELEAFRRLLFFSVPEAAKALGAVSEQAWRRWEAGTRKIPADVEEKVYKVLDWRTQTIHRMRQAIEAIPTTKTFPLLWYVSLNDWASLVQEDPMLWRAYLSACAVMTDEYKNQVHLVPFDRSAYTTWLGKQTDTAELRNAWAEDVIAQALRDPE